MRTIKYTSWVLLILNALLLIFRIFNGEWGYELMLINYLNFVFMPLLIFLSLILPFMKKHHYEDDEIKHTRKTILVIFFLIVLFYFSYILIGRYGI